MKKDTKTSQKRIIITGKVRGQKITIAYLLARLPQLMKNRNN